MRELVSAYPYIIRYRIDGDTVVILRIRHTSRRPTNPWRPGCCGSGDFGRLREHLEENCQGSGDNRA